VSYDPATTEGTLRMLIGDTEDPPLQEFTDAEIAGLLNFAGGSIARAAAAGLRSVAATRARLEKRIKSLDVEVDRRGVVKALIDLAKSYEDSDEASGGFAIAEMAEGAFARFERLRKEAQREGIA
jgi:hypothetical protein